MHGSAKTIHFILGIVGNVTSFCLFASPLPTMTRIWKNKSVEEFKSEPYIAGVMNCVFWVFYGLPMVSGPHNITVISINSLGLALMLGYLALFFCYSKNVKNQRLKIVGFLALEAAVACAVVVSTLVRVPQNRRAMVVGIIADIFSIILYASPLTAMWMVIKTKSVEYMPLMLSLSALANGLVWAVYAVIGGFDFYIFLSNSIGVVLGIIQLVVYFTYYKTTPKSSNDIEKKKQQQQPSEVQMMSA